MGKCEQNVVFLYIYGLNCEQKCLEMNILTTTSFVIYIYILVHLWYYGIYEKEI